MLYMRIFQAEQLGQKFYRARKFSYNFYAEEILFYPGLKDSSTYVYVCMYIYMRVHCNPCHISEAYIGNSGADSYLNLRGPHDVMNIGEILKLNRKQVSAMAS